MEVFNLFVPKRLTLGSTIGVVCPASPEDSHLIDEKISEFENLGYKIKKGTHIYDRYGYLAGLDEDRAKDFQDIYCDGEVDAVISFRGGYGTMRMMPYLNYKKILSNYKIFCGYSDLTILLNYLSNKYNMITFHSPMISSDFTYEDTLNSFLLTLMEGYKPYTIENPKGFTLESNTDISALGTLAGGNLSLICASLGTPYEMDFKDKILFIEEVDESPYAIDRMLTQLSLSGKLNECKGFILGQFTGCSLENYTRSLTLNQVLEEKLFTLNKPILFNFMSGHDNPKLTLPIGAKIHLDCKNKMINVLQKVVQ